MTSDVIRVRDYSDTMLSDLVWQGTREHVFYYLPIELLKLPEMVLMERNAVVEYVANKVEKEMKEEMQMDERGSGSPKHSPIVKQIAGRVTKRAFKATHFAILSHTWGKNELSHRDLIEQRNLHGEGYEKLKNFCNIAYNEYGVEFAWMDTVCIDKSSSTELDESIRSMFKWYRNSYVCIIFLSGSRSIADVERDRWFTRGWTLQEMLAPRRLKFYTADWSPLTELPNDISVGFTSSTFVGFDQRCKPLLDIVSRATGISRTDIVTFQPDISDGSISLRMKWIAGREATRVEDMAYCMMGIFGVSFSIAYGEGRTHAFFRLFKAILEVSNTPDLFNWAGEPIPRNIHRSRMIPSSAECYLKASSTPVFDRFTDEMEEPATLTNLGIRMTVLMVPIQLKFCKEGPIELALKYAARAKCMLVDGDIEVTLLAGVNFLSASSSDPGEFAFGIWNVAIPDKDGITNVPQNCAAIILHRDRWAPKWRKVPTTEVIAFAPTKELDETMRASMKVRTLYL